MVGDLDEVVAYEGSAVAISVSDPLLLTQGLWVPIAQVIAWFCLSGYLRGAQVVHFRTNIEVVNVTLGSL